MFSTANIGQNVNYKFAGVINGNETIIDYGNVISASGRNDRVLQGAFNVVLYNDNIRQGINVTVKMVAFQFRKTWENKSFTEQVVSPKYQKQLFREPIVTTNKVAVSGL